MPLLFVALGALMTFRFVQQQPLTAKAIGCVVASFVIGGALAAARVPVRGLQRAESPD